jgi:hypothetical protein
MEQYPNTVDSAMLHVLSTSATTTPTSAARKNVKLRGHLDGDDRDEINAGVRGTRFI